MKRRSLGEGDRDRIETELYGERRVVDQPHSQSCREWGRRQLVHRMGLDKTG